jgi:hypothetical protein
LVGWFGLGWWLAPVRWTNATPLELAPQWRTEYVVLAAEAYARAPNSELARARLSHLPPEAVRRTLQDLSSSAVDPALSTAASELLALAVSSGTVLAAEAGGGEAVSGSPPAQAATAATGLPAGQLKRAAARWAAILLGLAATATVVAALRRGRPQRATRRARPDDPTEPHLVVDMRSGPAEADSPAAGWSPQRVGLGEMATVRFVPPDPGFYRTWLIHDHAGSLCGGAGMRAQPLGDGACLELWFFERGVGSEHGETPAVTIVAPAVMDDPVLLARLGRAVVVPALPGRSFNMKTATFVLEATVEDAASPGGAAGTGLGGVTMTLAPRLRRIT